jgi:cell division septum initiation protein DivIVA
MTESDYVSHIAALTIAVEEGLSGEAADARAIELGSEGYSREDVEEFAALLRTRPLRWVEVEREVDARIDELREEASGPTGAGGE